MTLEGGEWVLLQTSFPSLLSSTYWTFFTLTHKCSCCWFFYSFPCPAGGGKSEQVGAWLMVGANPPQHGKRRLIMWSAEHEIMTPYVNWNYCQITLVDLHCSLPAFHKPLNKCTGGMSLALASFAKHIRYNQSWIFLSVAIWQLDNYCSPGS